MNKLPPSKLFAMKMNVVCGGGDNVNGPLSTCEYSNPGEDTWHLLNSLPFGMALNGLRLISVGYDGFYSYDLMIGMYEFLESTIFHLSTVFCSGGWENYGGSNFYDTVYALDINYDWQLWTNLHIARRYHAVSAIDVEDLWQYCK